jgi:hypothetical protein
MSEQPFTARQISLDDARERAADIAQSTRPAGIDHRAVAQAIRLAGFGSVDMTDSTNPIAGSSSDAVNIATGTSPGSWMDLAGGASTTFPATSSVSDIGAIRDAVSGQASIPSVPAGPDIGAIRAAVSGQGSAAASDVPGAQSSSWGDVAGMAGPSFARPAIGSFGASDSPPNATPAPTLVAPAPGGGQLQARVTLTNVDALVNALLKRVEARIYAAAEAVADRQIRRTLVARDASLRAAIITARGGSRR